MVLAVVAGFVLLAAGRYLIHGLWLAGVYAENAALWRTPIAMQHRVWVIQLANLILAAGAVLIYVRGVEPKPWLGQGVRFGILLALEYFTYPIPSTLAIQWIIGEGGLALLLGVLVAAICRPKASA
jgi:hypothetical protein